MSNLADLKAAAVSKLATVHADVTTYITALESKVKANRNISYGVAAVVALIAIVWIAHKL